jgi:hypothetical protein
MTHPGFLDQAILLWSRNVIPFEICRFRTSIALAAAEVKRLVLTMSDSVVFYLHRVVFARFFFIHREAPLRYQQFVIKGGWPAS